MLDMLLERWWDLVEAAQPWRTWFLTRDVWMQGLLFAAASALAALFVGAMLVWVLRRRPQRGEFGRVSLAELTRTPRIVAYATALVLVVGFGGWSLVAPLASAAVAHGVVSPDGNRKTVQHLEGGIIREIHVHEGDFVTPGQALVTLENVEARARHDELLERYYYLLATKARLMAERDGTAEITFPPELTATADAKAEGAMAGQREFLQTRLASQKGREDILTQRIRQLEEQNSGLREMIDARGVQLALIEQETAAVQELFDKGLTQQAKLLALRRATEEIRAERAGNRAQIAGNLERIGETQIQLVTMRQQDVEKASEQLTNIIRALGEVQSELPLREDVLDRTVIRSQFAGTVMELRVTTESGVIEPGQAILDIVPADADLIIDAKLRTVDIDNVEPGMQARVLLTAYRQRTLPQIHGVLRSVSADRIVEPRSGEAYFLAKVVVDTADLARVPDVHLAPGMPADVMILTGERTLFDYLMRPLSESMRMSFREN